MLRDIINLLRKDNLQERALAACYEMLDLCASMIDASIESLRRRDDAETDVDVAAVDKKINAFERDVRRKVMTHLSLGNEGDLTAGLTLISIVIDIERIGDYAKNIHDIAVHHPRRLEAGPLEEDLQSIEKESLALFRGASHAFKESDEEAARGLMQDYKDELSMHCRRLEEALVSGSVELASADAASLALYMRCLKRIGAHSRNLASSVVNPLDRIGYNE